MENTTYQLIDIQTGKIIQTYSYDKRKYARMAADRMDRKYGAVRYIVKPVFA